MKNVKVILWGLGAMGGGIGKMLCKKQGVDIVGAIDIGAKLSKSLYDVVPGIERGDREDVIVGPPRRSSGPAPPISWWCAPTPLPVMSMTNWCLLWSGA